jgi:monoamine oxidase
MTGHEQNEVIIIGAGAAGLAAARELTQAGIKPLIIEARHRVGGRVLTEHSDGVPLELGAEFIHGTPPETLDIVKQAGFETRPTSWSAWHFLRETGLEPADRSDRTGDEHIWEKLDQSVDGGGQDISLGEFLDRESVKGESRQTIEGYVGGFHAAEMDKIGVRSLVKTERAADRIHGNSSSRFPGGYDQVIKYLWHKAEEDGARLLLNSPVALVKWENNDTEVAISGKSDVYRAKMAIITLPIGVLKANSVVFEPSLVVKQPALAKIEMGAALRLVYHFKSKWWNEILRKVKSNAQPLGFLFAPEEPLMVWWSSEPMDLPLLTAWAGGKNALKLGRETREDLKRAGISSLSRIFGVDGQSIGSELINVGYHDWLHDQFSLGSYTYLAAGGGVEAPKMLAEPVENVLFFAGEATSYEGHWGTVHGAIASGIRAAREVIAAKA